MDFPGDGILGRQLRADLDFHELPVDFLELGPLYLDILAESSPGFHQGSQGYCPGARAGLVKQHQPRGGF